MAIVEEQGYPIALHIESASPGEATLVEKTIEAKIMKKLPPRLIGIRHMTAMASTRN